LVPDQDPDAVQAAAFAAFHDRVAAVPLETVLGLAVKLTLGVADFTEMVAD
jgi:tRNA A37 threonylcarbamoyladenosine synthetase subunit TsaC/SUA5/YrdC